MIEEISTILYESDNGVMVRLRDGLGYPTESEKAKILEFAKEANEHFRNNETTDREIAICNDIIFSFMFYPKLVDFTGDFYCILIKNIDF